MLEDIDSPLLYNFFLRESLFSLGSHYLLVHSDCGSYYFGGVNIHCYTWIILSTSQTQENSKSGFVCLLPESSVSSLHSWKPDP